MVVRERLSAGGGARPGPAPGARRRRRGPLADRACRVARRTRTPGARGHGRGRDERCRGARRAPRRHAIVPLVRRALTLGRQGHIAAASCCNVVITAGRSGCEAGGGPARATPPGVMPGLLVGAPATTRASGERAARREQQDGAWCRRVTTVARAGGAGWTAVGEHVPGGEREQYVAAMGAWGWRSAGRGVGADCQGFIGRFGEAGRIIGRVGLKGAKNGPIGARSVRLALVRPH